MVIWQQVSLFDHLKDQKPDNIVHRLKLYAEPTPYPIIKKAVEEFSKPGDVVFDPCCGNGTSGIAALELNRKAILWDINPLAVKVTRALFSFYDYNKVMGVWKEIRQNIKKSLEMTPLDWESFINKPIPTVNTFKIIKRVDKIKEIFHPEDLNILEKLYFEVSKNNELIVKELLESVFYSTLKKSSQLELTRTKRYYYIPKISKRKYPEEIFNQILEVLLESKSLIRELLAKNFAWTPKVSVGSIFNLDSLDSLSVDYVIFHLPAIMRSKDDFWNQLIEILSGHSLSCDQKVIINLDYRGRFNLAGNFKKILNGLGRILKEDGFVTVIFTGHLVLLTIIIQTAEMEGWKLVKLDLSRGNEDYPLISLTLQKISQPSIMGALNKMKCETLYDREEAILRKIEKYLLEHKTATTAEIQTYLIENHLHGCLIEKPIEDILKQNFIWTGRYWIRPSKEQKLDLYKLRRKIFKKSFSSFICEMIYRFLIEEGQPLTYEIILNKLVNLKPRMIFYTPYYRLLMEECENRKIKLHQLIHQFLEDEKKDEFETFKDIIRRLIKTDSNFIEIVPGSHLGLSDWTEDQFFKIYLELFEEARKNDAFREQKIYARKALEMLESVTYLTDEKKAKIARYLKRSEDA